MRTADDIVAFLAGRRDIVRLLDAVETLALSDGWIGAGLLRNAIWDELCGMKPSAPDDVDVAFFDPADTSGARDAAIEAALRCLVPGVPWSVKNQARMHARNGDAPYRDTADAIAQWPETATAIAARCNAGRIALLAPHGVADLLALTLRPTPAFASKFPLYRQRVARKQWRERWPGLLVLEA